jgi:spermidine synthase
MSLLRTENSRGLELKSYLKPFALGFLATSFQILLLREAESFFSGNELVYGFVLAFWLLGSSLGSLLADKKFLPSLTPEKFYALTMVFFALSLAGIRFSRFVFNLLPSETVGLQPALLTSLLTTLVISLPLGALFVYNVVWLQGNLLNVYLTESLGAAVGGLLVSLVLIPYFSGWQSAAIIILASGLIISFSLTGGKKALLLVTGILLTLLLVNLDLTTEKIYWQPLNFITARDSPYARIKLIKTGEQLSFYTNNVLAFNFPDLAAAEQAVHFPMLQRPGAKKVLLLGGGFNGSLEELLKYREANVDYVELDPVLVKLAKDFLQNQTSIFENHRLSFITMDGRKFLQEKPPASYEVIICQLPEPVSLQLNRYYTVEFFSLVKSRLTEDGLFSFSVPASENYLSDELAQFLASLYYSLTRVFEEVRLLPGDSVVFLASSHTLHDDFAYYEWQLRQLKLKTVYFRPEILAFRLTDFKKNYLQTRVKEAPQPKLNYDQTPISYYFNIVLWSKQFKSWEKKLLVFLARHSQFYLFHLPLILIVLLLLYSLRKKTVSWPVGWPLFFLGFSTMVAEIGLLLSFQVHSGLVYSKISLLLSLFMFGLFLGSWLAKNYLPAGQLWPLILCQATMVIFLALASLSYRIGSEYFYYGLFLAMGLLGGATFIVSNTLYLRNASRYGLGYAVDLAGSFLGALLASSLFIPLLGLNLLFVFLLLANSFCLLFIWLKSYSK